jgi:hypothetical protein
MLGIDQEPALESEWCCRARKQSRMVPQKDNGGVIAGGGEENRLAPK